MDPPPKNKLSIPVRFGIGAAIPIGQEIQCLSYAGFDDFFYDRLMIDW